MAVPYPERLREQFEGVIRRFRSSGQWWEMPAESGPWDTVYGRFRVWRDAGVFTALLEGLIAQGARVGRTDLSLVSVDSTAVRAHDDAPCSAGPGADSRARFISPRTAGVVRSRWF